MIKVSVIIPVYNVEKYLQACLDSVRCQTLQEIEIICIDDASPDRCGEILDDYAERDPRIRVFHLEENQMQGYGRNLGLKEAKGKYVYFLDSDDMITPEAMKELYKVCEEGELDGVFFDSQVIFESEELEKKCGSYEPVRKGTYPADVHPGIEWLDYFTAQDEYLVYVHRQFWRRSFLISNEIFNIERLEHEDEFFTFQAILLAERVKYIRKDYFIHRFRENSVMTRKPLPRDFHGYFITYNQMAAFAEKHGLETKGIDSCLMHMWDCVQNFSAVFEKENPKKWFSEEEQAWYRLYRTMLKTQQMVKKRDEAVLAPLEVYQSIEIYGAGRIAQAIYRRLSTQGIRVTGFWVSDRTNNPEELFGLPVRVISDYTDQPAGCAMLVAVAKQWHEEIADHLKQLHICFYSYAANHLAGPYGVSCEERK